MMIIRRSLKGVAGAGSGRPVPEPGKPVRYKADSHDDY